MPTESLYCKRKRLGLCPYCGKSVEDDHICCAACRQRERNRYHATKARMTEEQLAQKTARVREAQTARRNRLRAENRCTKCGAPSNGLYFCHSCMEKLKEYKKKTAENRKVCIEVHNAPVI